MAPAQFGSMVTSERGKERNPDLTVHGGCAISGV